MTPIPSVNEKMMNYEGRSAALPIYRCVFFGLLSIQPHTRNNYTILPNDV